MNQDDSLITPARDNAGRNMFEVGDYRYALNARIGSSRNDSMGDLENILGTSEVTDYFSNTSVIQNGDFQSGGLNFWDQTSDPSYLDWGYSAQGARVIITPSSGGGVGPAPQYQAKGTVAGSTSGSITPSYPAGIQAGDLIFLMAESRQPGQTAAGAINVPSGFTLVKSAYFRESSFVGLPNIAVLYSKKATGSETGTVTVTRNGPTGGNNTFVGQIYVYRGVSPIVESAEANSINFLGSPSVINFPALTLGAGGKRTLLAFTARPATTLTANPAGYATSAEDVVDSGTIHSSLKLCTHADVATDGAISAAANGDISLGWACFHVCIYDPTTGPTPTPFTTEAIYQTIVVPIAGQSLPLSFAVNASSPVQSGTIKVVYMNGGTIVSEQTVYNGVITNFVYGETITFPSGVDGVGVRVIGTATTPTNVYIPYVKLIAKTAGGRPAGDEKVIGRYQDDEFLRVWMCVWNSNNDHTIRYYDKKTNAVYEVLRWSGLNWQSTDYIKMAKLDNWIAFTGDKRNRPRLIDTDSITSLSLTLGDQFREYHISFHKRAPLNPPVPRIFYDGATNNFDRLKNKVFQFAYRYIYRGKLFSRWSPESKGATTCYLAQYYEADKITSIELDIPGAIFDEGSSDAYPFFDHNDAKFINAVESIEIGFKDGENQLWKLWKRIPVNSLFNRYHYFDGTGNLTPLDDDFIIPFDTVPFLAGTVEAVDNRFVFGDCLDELPPAVDVKATELNIYNNGQFDDSYWGDARKTLGFTNITNATARDRLLRLNATSRQTFKDRAIYKHAVQFFDKSGWRSGAYTDDAWTYEAADISGFANGQSALAFGFKLPSSFIPPEWAVGYQIMRTNALNMDYYMFGLANNFSPIVDDITKLLDQMNLPEDVKKRIQDRFRDSYNVSADDVMQETQAGIDSKIADNRRKDKRKRFWNTVLKVNEWVGIGSGSAGFTHFNRNLRKWFTRNPIGPQLQQQLRVSLRANALTDASRIQIDINNWLFAAQETQTKEYPLNNLIYNYRPGDRVRFTGSDIANPTNADLKEYDVPIIEFTGQSIIIEKPKTLQWISRYNQAGSVQDFMIEVYTPMVATAEDHIFYEMGEWYPVLNAGKPNRDFAKRDFTWAGEAAVVLNQYGPLDIYSKMPVFYGDSYLVAKTLYRSKVFWIDNALKNGTTNNTSVIFTSMVPDKDRTYDVWERGNGRPAPSYEVLPVPKFKATQVRYGGRIVEESFVNSLNQFEDPWQFIYPSEYGRIRDLVNTANAQVESVGSILLAIGERETWSIYVNRRTLEDLSGNTQVSISDDVLGSFNTLLGSHGTLNPESVSKFGGRVWYWNALDGSWIRYGRDGLTEISEYKMRNWFKDLGDLVIDQYVGDSIRPVVLSEYDSFNDELITFQDHSTLPAQFRGYDNYKGAYFSEDDKRWMGIHNYTPEMMSKIGNQVIAFRGGSVFLLEKGTGNATYFGVKHDVMWEPVFNDSPKDNKSWKAIGVAATDRWAVQRILSEYRGLKLKQQTSIPMNAFQDREDVKWADLRRDENTPNKANPRIDGNEMRSKAIQVLLKLDPEVVHRTLLHYVEVEMTDSPKNA
jgi:hypothetical protein